MRKPVSSLLKESSPESRQVIDLYKFGNKIESVINDHGTGVFDFLSNHIDLNDEHNMVMMTRNTFNIHSLSDHYFDSIVNLTKINDIQRINKFFESINAKLPNQGTFIGCVETKGARKKRILNKFPVGFGYVYYSFDFVFKRIFPKLPFTKSIYFFVTAGRNRVLSRTETLGRLYSCGFTIAHDKKIGNNLYFVAKKKSQPFFDKQPSYGLVCKLKRSGKNGKPIHVYKFRTMHPYSEYLQEYIYDKNKLREGGKISNDFRVSTWGRFMRRYWIDEIPMIWNLFKGDMKIVGVRPLSNHYQSLYTEELKLQRRKHKPGLVPPFYADMPKTLEEIMASEKKYLDSYEKTPFFTDFTYFFKILKSIIFKRARSN
jgi:lipopolysaccharide/colanic/teichoic acid biosynthesis glycosyltransferase